MPLRIRMPALALLGGIKAFFIRSTFTPLSLSPALWLDAADSSTITQASGLVSQWNDKSGNGRNVTQSDNARRPSTNATTLNGLNVLSSGGGKTLFNSSAAMFRAIGGGALFIVARSGTAVAAGGDVFTYIVTPLPNTRFGLFQTVNSTALGGRRLNSDTFQQITSPNNTSNQNVLASALVDYQNTTATLFNNGTQVVQSTTFQTAGVTSNDGGALYVFGDVGFGQTLTGIIAEIIYLEYLPTTTQRQLVEGYLAWKWGLQASLPVGHPYKIINPNGWNRTTPWIKIGGVWKQATPFIKVSGTWK